MVDKSSGGEGHGHMDVTAEPDGDEDDLEFVETDPSRRYVRYREVLGKGAFKIVYRAFDELEGMEVAWNQVKVQDVLQNPEDLERLYSEVHLLKTLKHKNIIKFYNSWVDIKNDNINFITEIFTSGTLRQYRKRHKRVTMRAVKNWARQILRGLLYLHSHDPPIIHRDLKCDNIFVNGNQGEVKIGDLGLAAILRQAHAAHSVIGTPEFMAPELYEEEYNELVDIYAFGMCLLEMITSEYPYSECTNAAQIYKKVTSGIKPAALDKVKDPQVRQFVDKCLASASRRLPARELLMDPFLQYEDGCESMDLASCPSHLHALGNNRKESATFVEESGRSGSSSDASCVPKLRFSDAGNFKQVEYPKLSVKSNAMMGLCIGTESASVDNYYHAANESEDQVSLSSAKEDGLRAGRDFTVKGQRKDDNIVYLRLRIADSKGHVRNIHFPFDIDADTAISVASEMVAELDLSDQDVTNIAAMIDEEIPVLVPEWKPGAAFEDTAADEEMCNDYHTSGIEDGYSEILNDGDSPSGAFVLDRLPSGRKYWSDSPRSLTGDSCKLMNASSQEEDLTHRRIEEGNCDQSVPSNSPKQCDEINTCNQTDCHGNDGNELNAITQASNSLGSVHSDGNVLAINQDKGHSKVDVVNSTGMTEVGMPTYEKQVNCKIQEIHNCTGQQNFQKEDCRIFNGLRQYACAVKCDDINVPEFHSSTVLPEGTDMPTDIELEDTIAQKLQHLIVKQKEELEGLKQKHKQAIQYLINQLQEKSSTVNFSRHVPSLICNDIWYKVPVNESSTSKRASMDELLDQAYNMNCREESDASLVQNVSHEEFNSMTSVFNKETAHEAACEDIDDETAKKGSPFGLAECQVSTLNKTTSAKATKQFYSERCTGNLEHSSFTDSMSKIGMVGSQINIPAGKESFKQDLVGLQFKLADNAVKDAVSNCMNTSHGIDVPGKHTSLSFVEFYKGASPLRDRPSFCRGDVKSSGTDPSGDVPSNSSKAKNNDKLFDQLKKEQLQKSIAELEAKTLEGLQQSKSGYLISSSGRKPSARVSQAGPVGSNACITRQKFTPETGSGRIRSQLNRFYWSSRLGNIHCWLTEELLAPCFISFESVG